MFGGRKRRMPLRRDFTINAMYYDPSSGEVVDYHKGIQDAKRKSFA
jgi:poly(A) polymerase